LKCLSATTGINTFFLVHEIKIWFRNRVNLIVLTIDIETLQKQNKKNIYLCIIPERMHGLPMSNDYKTLVSSVCRNYRTECTHAYIILLLLFLWVGILQWTTSIVAQQKGDADDFFFELVWLLFVSKCCDCTSMLLLALT